MSYSYSWQKCYEAVSCLAASPESLSKRMEYALVSLLPLKMKPEDHFHDQELRGRFEALVERCSRIDTKGNEGRIVATVQRMNDEELTSIAQEIIDLHNTIAIKYGSEWK